MTRPLAIILLLALAGCYDPKKYGCTDFRIVTYMYAYNDGVASSPQTRKLCIISEHPAP